MVAFSLNEPVDFFPLFPRRFFRVDALARLVAVESGEDGLSGVACGLRLEGGGMSLLLDCEVDIAVDGSRHFLLFF